MKSTKWRLYLAVALAFVAAPVFSQKKAGAEECGLLKGPRKPRVMVVVPETQLLRKVPDPAGEAEVARRLKEEGFELVDEATVAAIRDQERTALARTDAGKAAQLGAEFGADVIVIGEAFSEAMGPRDGLQSCRARLEARVISTASGRVLAANGTQAAGLDGSELVAGKKALASAGGSFADYLIGELCRLDSLGGGGEMVSSSEILLASVSFSQLNTVFSYLKGLPQVRNVSKTLSGPSGRLLVVHTGTLDDLAALLDGGQSGVAIAITGLGDSRVEGVVR